MSVHLPFHLSITQMPSFWNSWGCICAIKDNRVISGWPSRLQICCTEVKSVSQSWSAQLTAHELHVLCIPTAGSFKPWLTAGPCGAAPHTKREQDLQAVASEPRAKKQPWHQQQPDRDWRCCVTLRCWGCKDVQQQPLWRCVLQPTRSYHLPGGVLGDDQDRRGADNKNHASA